MRRVVARELVTRPRDLDTGVVDEDVDTAEAVDRLTCRNNHPVSVRCGLAPPTRQPPAIVERGIGVKIPIVGPLAGSDQHPGL